MKTLLAPIIISLLTPILMASSCEKHQEHKCPENTICTMMFAAVSVQVSNSNGEPVTFDEVYTQRKSNNEIIKLDQNRQDGYYTVLDDSYQKKMANETDTFHFIGMKDGKKIVDEIFVISADCCHVNKVSGKSEITVP